MTRAAPSPPADAYVEVTVETIGEGNRRLTTQINESLREAFRGLVDRRDRGESAGTARITAEIRLEWNPDARDHVNIVHSVSLKTPKVEVGSIVKERGGRMLCQAEGSSMEPPEQMRLFDSMGRPRGTMDRVTGELLEESPIAGRVGG